MPHRLTQSPHWQALPVTGFEDEMEEMLRYPGSVVMPRRPEGEEDEEKDGGKGVLRFAV